MATTFKQFLEGAPSDKGFISMMNQIMGDIPEIKQKKDEFENKLRRVAADIPRLIQKQKDLEAWMDAAVKQVMTLPNLMLQKYMHELNGLEKEYQEGVSILDMLSYHLDMSHQHERVKRGGNRTMSDDADEWRPIVIKFIQKHGDDIEDCIRAVDHGLEAIKDMANKEDWPVPWGRYGSLSTEKNMFHHMQEELLYWVKELRK